MSPSAQPTASLSVIARSIGRPLPFVAQVVHARGVQPIGKLSGIRVWSVEAVLAALAAEEADDKQR